MPYTLTSPRPSHGSLNWDTNLETDLAGLAGAINGGGWVTTGVTSQGNWTLNGARYRVLNGVVSLNVSLTRTVSALGAASSSGIYTGGFIIANLPAAITPAWANGVLQSVGVNATVMAACQITATGGINLTNMAPGYSLPVGGVLDLMGTYFL